MKMWQSCRKGIRFKNISWTNGQNKIYASWLPVFFITCCFFINIYLLARVDIKKYQDMFFLLKSPTNKTFFR